MIHLPRQGYEWAAFLAFWFGGVWVLCYELFFVAAFYHESWNAIVYIHIVCAGFLALNIYHLMFMMISTEVGVNKRVPSTRSETSNETQPSWRYCDKCSQHVPPRSHHCKLCDVCILKRDHHCWFAGYCIGFANHRYYLAMTFYITVAAIYGNVYHWDYLMAVKGGFAWTTIPGLFAPHAGLIFGQYTAFEFFITVNASIGFLCLFLFLYLFLTQVSLIWTGQVQYERKKKIFDYSLSPRENFQQVLGTAGPLVFICPHIPSELPSDGTSFQCRKDKSS